MTAPRIVEEEAWRARAACAEVGPDVFYPPPPGWDNEERGYDEARLVCKRCPVQTDCLNYALNTRAGFGMWGGMTPRERYRIRTSRRSK